MTRTGDTQSGARTLAQIRAILAANYGQLAQRYNLSELGVFGSYGRGEQRADSDIDMLVAFSVTPSLFTLIALEDVLHELLGAPIDLAVKSALRPHIGEHILREVVTLDRDQLPNTPNLSCSSGGF
jgi:uncharacterized protein